MGDGIAELGRLVTDVRDELHKLVWDMGGGCVSRMIKGGSNDIECGI